MLKETQIYRIDHYLGKETVQNILVFRFSNGIFEPCGTGVTSTTCRSRCRRVWGSSGAAAYYEQAGCLRDMIPNHILQLVR